MPTLRLLDVGRTFSDTTALDRAEFAIEQGEFVAIEGPSGSGKSTLLNVLGLLDRPTRGAYRMGDVETGALSEREITSLRSSTFAFVFQSFHLLDTRPVIDSVELGLAYRGFGARERRERARAALASVGLERLSGQRASLLSGGERQRVAIARALAAQVPVIVADEPTGNLDSTNSAAVVDLLRSLNRAGSTVVIVTHDPTVAGHAQRRFRVDDGVVTEVAQAGRPVASAMPLPVDASTPQRWTARAGDVARDALANAISRVGRTLGLVAAVGVAVGLSIATAGLAQSASQQVKQTFDAQSNRDVTVSWGPRGLDALSDEERSSLLDRVAGIRGVSSVAIVAAHGESEIRAGKRSPRSVAVFSASNAIEKAARLDVEWSSTTRRLEEGEVLIGETLARQLELAPISTRPVVHVGSGEFEVVGTIASSPRIERLPSSVVVADVDAGAFLEAQKSTALILTTTGAARHVATQAPLTVNPYDASALKTQAPPDPRTLRDSIESDVQTSMLALSAVALVAAIVGLGNAMMSAVLERRQEFGLRRALGARPRQLFSLVVVESALVGAAGGAAGLFGGLITILGVTIARRWAPVIDPALIPLALVGGVVVGSVAGVVAAARASRVLPSEALRL